MEDPGEHLVGQYLREVMKCDFVEYNLQIISVQGEIDVVGINSHKKEVFICEVATHLETGLQYTKNNQPDNVDRFIRKFQKSIPYANTNFPDFEKHFMLWSPIVKNQGIKAKHNQLQDIHNIQKSLYAKCGVPIKQIIKLEYARCLGELREFAARTTQALNSPILRLMQIEERLKKHTAKMA